MRGRVQGEGRPVADGIQGLIFVEGERDRRGGEVCGDSAGMNRDAIVTAGTVARDAYRSARCPTRRRAAGRMLLGVTHAEHHETTRRIVLFPCRSAKTLSAGRVVERSRIILGCL